MHGQIPHSLEEKLVDKEQPYQWLKFGDSEGEQKANLWQLRIRQTEINICHLIYEKVILVKVVAVEIQITSVI